VRRTTVQPTQLSLLPDQVPAPPVNIINELPEPDVGAALAVLARLIAQAASPRPAVEGRAVGDE
jgi:hypothetical protein